MMQDGILYRKSYLQHLLMWVGPVEANYLIREFHKRACSSHIRPSRLAKNIMRNGYYLPTFFVDVFNFIKKCHICQVYAPMNRKPQHELFAQWGIDLVMPFLVALEGYKFLIMVMDYFTKWVEAEAFIYVTRHKFLKFFWKHTICHFMISLKVVYNNGK